MIKTHSHPRALVWITWMNDHKVLRRMSVQLFLTCNKWCLVIPLGCILYSTSLVPNSSFSFWPHHMAYGILVLESGVEPRPLTMRAQSSNHWTARGFPKLIFYSTVPVILLALPHCSCHASLHGGITRSKSKLWKLALKALCKWTHSCLSRLDVPTLPPALLWSIWFHPSIHPPATHPPIHLLIHSFV